MRKYYLLQLREKKYKNRYIPNEEKETIGIFSSLKNTINWMKTYGNKWIFGEKYFWIIKKIEVDSQYDYNCYFYNLKGKYIKRPYKGFIHGNKK